MGGVYVDAGSISGIFSNGDTIPIRQQRYESSHALYIMDMLTVRYLQYFLEVIRINPGLLQAELLL